MRELTNPGSDPNALNELQEELRMIKKIESFFKPGKNRNWFFRDHKAFLNQSFDNIDSKKTKFEDNRRSHAVEASDSVNLIEEP